MGHNFGETSVKIVKYIYKCIMVGIQHYKSKKDILFIAYNDLMFSYALLYYKLLNKNRKFRLWICFPNKDKISNLKIKIYKKKYSLNIMPMIFVPRIPWDLVIQFDHDGFWSMFTRIKRVLIEHGICTGKNMDYLYGNKNTINKDGSLIYQKLFFPGNSAIAMVHKFNPKLKDSAINTGSLMADQFYRLLQNCQYKSTRKRKTIAILSTWGENSLIQKEGQILIDQIKMLGTRYDFVLSIHPNNYVSEHSGGIDWKHILVDLEKRFNLELIKDPFSWMRYLAYTDVLISDHTSLLLYFLLADRPVIYLDLGKNIIDEDSPINDVKKNAITVTHLKELENNISDAIKYYKPGCFKPIVDSIFGHLGNAEDITYKEINRLFKDNFR